ncbi:MAG: PilZ domain-containing protein [bacterium]
MLDKRKYPRVHDDLGIAVTLVDHANGSAHGAQRILHITENISRGGLQFKHQRDLPIDALVRIHVALKFPLKTITHLACVRWVRQNGHGTRCSVGVEFTETPPVDMLHWSHYIERKLKDASLS